MELYQKGAVMSKVSQVKTACMKFFALVLTNLVWVPSFYRFMATKTLGQQILHGMLGLTLFYSIITMPIASVLPAVTMISVILITMPFVLFASIIDPFVGWIRGDFEKPWQVVSKAVAVHLWTVLSPMFALCVLMIVTLPLGIVDLKDPEVSQSGPGIVFLIYALLAGWHMFFALKGCPEMRKHQKFVSWLLYIVMFWAAPIAHLANYVLAKG